MDTRYKITRHVAWSRYVTIVTIVICLVFAGVAFWAESLHIPVILFTCIGIVIISAFYYSPAAVTVDRRNVTIRRLLTPKHIAVGDIKEVRLFQTTMDVRICGSGGFFGYYGWFRNREIGNYFAYVGKWKDTFMIELNSGRKYIISCNQPEVIVKSIMDMMK
ncbi:MAG: hypothetical protein K2J97_05220 [Muribaculaceae bacterium]|nr:hypothetical protein [Muribaculaceae bacterium]